MSKTRRISIENFLRYAHPLRNVLADIESTMCTEGSSLDEASLRRPQIMGLAEKLSELHLISVDEKRSDLFAAFRESIQRRSLMRPRIRDRRMFSDDIHQATWASDTE